VTPESQRKRLFDEMKVRELLGDMGVNVLGSSARQELLDYIDTSILNAVKSFAEKIRPDDKPPMQNLELKSLCEMLNMRIDAALKELEGKKR